jgi:hypothetical protein
VRFLPEVEAARSSPYVLSAYLPALLVSLNGMLLGGAEAAVAKASEQRKTSKTCARR